MLQDWGILQISRAGLNCNKAKCLDGFTKIWSFLFWYDLVMNSITKYRKHIILF